MRIYPLMRHKKSRLLYVGTTRGANRVESSGLARWVYYGPSYVGLEARNFELVGIARLHLGPYPAEVDVLTLPGCYL